MPLGMECYSLKLEFPDGRWDVEESRFDATPAVGDVIELERRGRWQVTGSQLVTPRPDRLPRRTFFICAPAA
jgi:hypothetical protein